MVGTEQDRKRRDWKGREGKSEATGWDGVFLVCLDVSGRCPVEDGVQAGVPGGCGRGRTVGLTRLDATSGRRPGGRTWRVRAPALAEQMEKSKPSSWGGFHMYGEKGWARHTGRSGRWRVEEGRGGDYEGFGEVETR